MISKEKKTPKDPLGVIFICNLLLKNLGLE